MNPKYMPRRYSTVTRFRPDAPTIPTQISTISNRLIQFLLGKYK